MHRYYDSEGRKFYTPNFAFAVARAEKFKTYIVETLIPN